jgi:DNA-binding CsgD family transcriptional regulator
MGYREIRLSLVARALDCVSVWLVMQDLCGRLGVTAWDREARVTLRGRAVDEKVLAMLAGAPVLRPTIDNDGAIALTVRPRQSGLTGWRLIGAVTYGVMDLEVTTRMVPVLADPAMLEHPGPRTPAKASLTAREAEILTLVGEGLKARSIARRCGISERTVHKHLEQVYRKLDCHDRLSALLLARDTSLLAGGALVPAT